MSIDLNFVELTADVPDIFYKISIRTTGPATESPTKNFTVKNMGEARNSTAAILNFALAALFLN